MEPILLQGLLNNFGGQKKVPESYSGSFSARTSGLPCVAHEETNVVRGNKDVISIKMRQNGYLNISQLACKSISISFRGYVPHAIPAMGWLY
jgi:hypothetical protein